MFKAEYIIGSKAELAYASHITETVTAWLFSLFLVHEFTTKKGVQHTNVVTTRRIPVGNNEKIQESSQQ